jgi:RNA polymerase sigma factor (sigma-70 family)
VRLLPATAEPGARARKWAPAAGMKWSRPDAASSVAGVAKSAARGDERAWCELVARFDPMLRRIVRGYRLDNADLEDVVQTTWIRAFRSLDRLNEPAAIGGWLAITARRESLRALQRGVREFPAEEPMHAEEPAGHTPETVALERERRTAVRNAVRRLPGRQRDLLVTMLHRPCASYGEISQALDMPVGSIGPTRERAIGRLRSDGTLVSVVAA